MDENSQRHADADHKIALQAFAEARFASLALETTLAVLSERGILGVDDAEVISARLGQVVQALRGTGPANQGTTDYLVARTQTFSERLAAARRR